MNIVQSYLTTVMKGNFSLYEVRIFVKIVEHANKALNGASVIDAVRAGISADNITANITVPIREILTDGSNDYSKIFEACKSLSEKTIELWNTKSGQWVKMPDMDENGNTHYFTHMIDNVRYVQGTGKIKFTCAVWLLQYILDFVNNQFSMYDLGTALSLPTPYSVRLYWLTCSMSNPVTYPLQMLREILGIGEKYKNPKDFCRRVLDPPIEIFKERGLNGYTYKKNKRNQGATSPIVSITIIPVKRAKITAAAANAKMPLSQAGHPDLRQYLYTQCSFTTKDLCTIKDVLFNFSRIPNFRQIIYSIVEKARKKRAGKGYIINAMRSEISEKLSH